MVTILISTAFRGEVHYEERHLLEESALFQCSHPKEQHILEGALVWGPAIIREKCYPGKT